MTQSIDPQALDQWTQTHFTDPRVAEAIFYLAGDDDEAERIWQEPTPEELTAIWERATQNGLLGDDMAWGETSLHSMTTQLVEPIPNANNQRRAERARKALLSQDYGENGMHENGAMDIVDILADLMHYADAYQQAFAESMRIAENHYKEELAGHDDPDDASAWI